LGRSCRTQRLRGVGLILGGVSGDPREQANIFAVVGIHPKFFDDSEMASECPDSCLDTAIMTPAEYFSSDTMHPRRCAQPRCIPATEYVLALSTFTLGRATAHYPPPAHCDAGACSFRSRGRPGDLSCDPL
jgi:hypothetical protein